MKWIGWLAKLVITVVTVSMLTVMTTGYVVNTYIQSLLGSYNLPIAGKAPTLGGMMKGMFGFGGDDKDKKEAEGGGTDVTSGIGDTDGTSATGGTGGSRGMDDSEGAPGEPELELMEPIMELPDLKLAKGVKAPMDQPVLPVFPTAARRMQTLRPAAPAGRKPLRTPYP